MWVDRPWLVRSAYTLRLMKNIVAMFPFCSKELIGSRGSQTFFYILSSQISHCFTGFHFSLTLSSSKLLTTHIVGCGI